MVNLSVLLFATPACKLENLTQLDLKFDYIGRGLAQSIVVTMIKLNVCTRYFCKRTITLDTDE